MPTVLAKARTGAAMTSHSGGMDVTAAVLPNLTAEDLKELGVALVGDRHQLLEAIVALRGDPIAAAGQNSVLR